MSVGRRVTVILTAMHAVRESDRTGTDPGQRAWRALDDRGDDSIPISLPPGERFSANGFLVTDCGSTYAESLKTSVAAIANQKTSA